MTKIGQLAILVIVMATIFLNYLIILKYEKTLTEQDFVKGGEKKNIKYQPNEIKLMIIKMPEYIGDSISFGWNNKLFSSNPKFQGTINSVINSSENMKLVNIQSKISRKPQTFCIYKLAAQYYRDQYREEFNK